MRILPQIVLCSALAALASGQREGTAPPPRLRQVEVRTADIFGPEWTGNYTLSKFVNALHATTKEGVVRREIWLQPGQPVSRELADEVERNLRATGLFAEVKVELVAVEGTDEVDLVVTTRDKLSLSFGGGASYVGGVAGFRAAIGEGNLLGTGDRIALTFSQNSDKEYRGSIAYTDLHVLDTWHVGNVRFSSTDEGDSFGLDLRRPIKHLADPFGYGGNAHRDEEDIEYYRDGESVAQVFTRSSVLAGDTTWASGPRDQRRYLGFAAQLADVRHRPATGPMAPMIDVPGDTLSLYLGVHARWELIDDFRKIDGLDTIDYVQDLQLGLSLTTTAGVRWRDEAGQDGAAQPEAGLRLEWAKELLDEVFVDCRARGTARWQDGDTVGWQSQLGTWLFVMTGKDNTVGLSATYDAAEELQDLPIEFTLGEDNGLRGYPARQLSGTRRLRVNLENRFDTRLEYATFRLGVVTFFDAGWVGDDRELGSPYESVGVGLRVASKPLLGDGLLRLDLAKPLDEAVGTGDGWRVSFAVGQVFTFGGNASALGTR